MRICVGDDEDFPGQFALYQANLSRALKGRKGQAALRELREALTALPEKRLAGHVAMEQDTPDVCARALGVLALHRGRTAEDLRALDPDDETAMTDLGLEMGLTYEVAWAIVYENDEGTYRAETPGQRYERMVSWVDRQILWQEYT